jgi:hypothetical protein
MSIHDALSAPAYWSDAVPWEAPGLSYAAGVSDDLENQVSLLIAQAQCDAYTERLVVGDSLADTPNKVPLHMRDNPWVLAVTIDRLYNGKVHYPNGLLMGRQKLLTPADFDEQAQALAENSVNIHLPAAALAADGETSIRTIRRETLYCLGRTILGTAPDSRMNGTPSMSGLSGERLGKPRASYRDFITHIPTDTTVGAAYTNRSGTKKQVVAAATLIIPRSVPPQQSSGHRRRTVTSLTPFAEILPQTC